MNTVNVSDFICCKRCKRPFGFGVELARVCRQDVGRGRASRAALCTECAGKSVEVGRATKTKDAHTMADYVLSLSLRQYKTADVFRGSTYNAAIEVDSRNKKAIITFPPCVNGSGEKARLRTATEECSGWKKAWIAVELPYDTEIVIDDMPSIYGLKKTGYDNDGRCVFESAEQNPNILFWQIQFLREIAVLPTLKKSRSAQIATVLQKYVSGKAFCQKSRCNSK